MQLQSLYLFAAEMSMLTYWTFRTGFTKPPVTLTPIKEVLVNAQPHAIGIICMDANFHHCGYSMQLYMLCIGYVHSLYLGM